jgi:nitrogen-specific signal transduction histidine kinase
MEAIHLTLLPRTSFNSDYANLTEVIVSMIRNVGDNGLGVRHEVADRLFDVVVIDICQNDGYELD